MKQIIKRIWKISVLSFVNIGLIYMTFQGFINHIQHYANIITFFGYLFGIFGLINIFFCKEIRESTKNKESKFYVKLLLIFDIVLIGILAAVGNYWLATLYCFDMIGSVIVIIDVDE